MKSLLLLGLSVMVLNIDGPVQAEELLDPETRVEISIYDLIGKLKIKKADPKLSADYGDRVAKVIGESQSQIKACLQKLPKGMSLGPHPVQALIQIRSDGSAQVGLPKETAIQGTLDCISAVLSSLHYPTHPLAQPVKVNLPLQMKREVR